MHSNTAQVSDVSTSVDSAKTLCQFYTKPEVAAACIDLVRQYLTDERVDLWIEPSAGEGAFLHQLPSPRVGIDIDPKAPDIQKADFLAWQPPSRSSDGLVVVIGNPPYGKNASEAVRFCNHAASFCDVLAFLVPRSFEKGSVHRRLDKHFWLEQEAVLDPAVFVHKGKDVVVPAVFQIWRRRAQKRIDPKEPLSHSDFAFVRDRHAADFSLQRVGVGAGQVRFDFDDRAASSHYFIKIDSATRPVADILDSIDWSEVKAQCAGNPSIAKTEIVRLYREQIGEIAPSGKAKPILAIGPTPGYPVAANDDEPQVAERTGSNGPGVADVSSDALDESPGSAPNVVVLPSELPKIANDDEDASSTIVEIRFSVAVSGCHAREAIIHLILEPAWATEEHVVGCTGVRLPGDGGDGSSVILRFPSPDERKARGRVLHDRNPE